MIKTNGTETQGKYAGTIFRSDQCRQHLQEYHKPNNYEPTPAQKSRRRAFSKCTGYIRRHATLYFAAAWQDYANKHPKKTCKGKIYTLTWWQQFIGYNINRIIAGEEIEPLPPGYTP